ncbi:MAG: TolC family outer membrane protein [Pseudomonadota bacterium]
MTALGAPLSAQTLSEALEGAYQNNPSIQIARSSLLGADEDVAAALAAAGPQVNANASGNQTRSFETDTNAESWSVDITATQNIYAGGRALLGIQAAELANLSARQDVIDIEQNVLLAAVQAFMDVRRDSDVVRLNQNTVRVLNEQLRAANDRFEVGEVTRTDVSQTEARLAAARATLEATRGQFNVSRETYRATIGGYPTSLFEPSGLPSLPQSADQAEDIAINSHPRMLSAQFDQTAAELGLEIARRALRPTITGSVSLQRSNPVTSNNSSDSGSIGIQGSIPIYQSGALNSDIRAAAADLNAAKSALQLAALTTKQSVRSAYANWQASVASIGASDEQVRAARIAFDGVSEEASLGARTTLDVLDAEQELRNAQSNLISAKRDEVVARFSVLAEMGQLTAEKLNLNVAYFDPVENYNEVTGANSKLGQRRNQLLDKILERSGN